MSTHVERMTENEIRFREANERIDRVASEHANAEPLSRFCANSSATAARTCFVCSRDSTSRYAPTHARSSTRWGTRKTPPRGPRSSAETAATSFSKSKVMLAKWQRPATRVRRLTSPEHRESRCSRRRL